MRHEIEDVLRRYAGKYGVAPAEVRRLSYGYVEDIVDDLFGDPEEQLDRDFREFTSKHGTIPDLPASR